MMNKLTILSCALILAFASTAAADVVLPRIIGSKAVLQRDRAAPIWGWADPDEQVTVEFAGQVKQATAGQDGSWIVHLDPMDASSKPRVMTIRGRNTITLDDILVGEVWLAAGQSNMEWPFCLLAQDEQNFAVAQRDNQQVRAFHVEQHLTAGVPMDDTIGRWKDCEDMVGGDLRSVSAVGFFFALKLQQELGVPVAILDANWGGQPIQAFIPEEGYKALGLPLSRVGYDPNPAALVGRLEAIRASIDNSIAAAQNGRKVAPLVDDRVFGWARNGIYNAMIAPLTPCAIKGVIWYQGESNRGASDYFPLLQALSAGFSEVFGIENIPLYQAQIAPYNYNRGQGQPNSLLCDTIWTAQYRGADEIPGMGIVPTHDTKIDVNDIHPKYKRTVGERLAAKALKNQYGRDVVASGPRFAGATPDGAKVVVSFRDLDQGLTTNDGAAPTWFELSVDGRHYVTAEAQIVGNQVEVSATAIAAPQFVRMGWNEIAIPNLADRNGWPVHPFSARLTELHTEASVSPEKLERFMQQWKEYQSFEAPMEAEDEPLLQAALEKDPSGPWATYLSYKFAQNRFEARELDDAQRAALYRASLEYLRPARETISLAVQSQPKNANLRHHLQRISEHIALASLEAGLDRDTVRAFAEATLAENEDSTSSSFGDFIFFHHTLLGRVALRDGRIDDAKAHLLASGRTPGSPSLNSFGPDFVLARELADEGERDTVISFLDLVAGFWAKPTETLEDNSKQVALERQQKLDAWKAQLLAGAIPDDTKWR